MMATQEEFTELVLPCTLTADEVQSRGRMLGETIWSIDETQAARTETMKSFKERLVGLNETQRKLAKAIRSRMEERMVRCVMRFHVPCEGSKRILRIDTGEVVREEPLTESEKQMNLFAAQQEFERFMQDQKLDQPSEEEAPGWIAPDEPEAGSDAPPDPVA